MQCGCRDVLLLCAEPSNYHAPPTHRPGPYAVALILHQPTSDIGGILIPHPSGGGTSAIRLRGHASFVQTRLETGRGWRWKAGVETGRRARWGEMRRRKNRFRRRNFLSPNLEHPMVNDNVCANMNGDVSKYHNALELVEQ